VAFSEYLNFKLELIIGAKKPQDNRGFARKWKESEKESDNGYE
jgi:hypothetical protein